MAKWPARLFGLDRPIRSLLDAQSPENDGQPSGQYRDRFLRKTDFAKQFVVKFPSFGILGSPHPSGLNQQGSQLFLAARGQVAAWRFLSTVPNRWREPKIAGHFFAALKPFWPEQLHVKTGRHDYADTWNTGQRFNDGAMLGLPVKVLKLLGHFTQLLLKKSQLSQVALYRQTPLG